MKIPQLVLVPRHRPMRLLVILLHPHFRLLKWSRQPPPPASRVKLCQASKLAQSLQLANPPRGPPRPPRAPLVLGQQCPPQSQLHHCQHGLSSQHHSSPRLLASSRPLPLPQPDLRHSRLAHPLASSLQVVFAGQKPTLATAFGCQVYQLMVSSMHACMHRLVHHWGL